MPDRLAAYDDLTYLELTIDEGVAVVTLGPTFTEVGHREVARILPRLNLDQSVRAIVLTGRGDVFCIGPERSMTQKLSEDGPDFVAAVMEEVRALVLGAVDCEKPVVSALNGPASGGPMTFALLADIVIAERQVPFSDMHVTAAVAAGDGGVLLYPLAIGLMRAKRYLLTGDAMSADEAFRFGLITEVVEKGQAFERAMTYARRLAAGPRHAIRHTKRALNQWMRLGLPAFETSWAGEILTASAPDAREGWTALHKGEAGVLPADTDAARPAPSQFGAPSRV